MTLVIIIGGYFGSKEKIQIKRPQNSTISVGTNQTAPDNSSKEFTVTAKEFSLTPTKLAVNKGEKVRIWFVNDGASEHNINIPEFNLKSDYIASGEKTFLEFEPINTGTFQFYCGVGGHKDLGMQGSIIVQ